MTDKKCEFDDCENKVTEDHFCHGCKAYICEEHSMCVVPYRNHTPDDHWNQCPVCGEHMDVCKCEEEKEEPC